MLEFIQHVDTHLDALVVAWGPWTYVVLAVVIFCETGLVATPFLPGDSLLFAVGAVAARGSLSLGWVLGLLIAAAVAGDTVNYWIGTFIGPKVFRQDRSRFFKREYLERTHRFYERYGGKTIILARFIPIVRTFAPFVAGVGRMSYGRFLAYNVVGGVVWVLLFVLGGYWFGNLPMVQRHFEWVIAAIIGLSLLPALLEYLRHRRAQAIGAVAREEI